MTSFVDRFFDGVEDLYDGLRGWSKADHTQYFPIACPHDDQVLALYNGSLMSVIRINGYMGQYFPQQFKALRSEWIKFIRNSTAGKNSSGSDLFWFLEFDPDGMKDEIMQSRKLMIDAGKRRGIGSEDVLLEEARVYGGICARERQYLLVVTHLDSLPKADQAGALAERMRDIKSSAKGRNGMTLKAGVRALEALHEQQVNKIKMFMSSENSRYSFERLDSYAALKEMRFSLLPDGTGPGWKALLKPKDVRSRATEEVRQSFKDAQGSTGKPNDWTFKLPPKLSNQMLEDAIDLGKYAVMGDRIYAPMYVSELATNPEHLESFLETCYTRRLPVRLAYSLMTNSSQANYWNRLFASVFSFASQSNRQISKADQALSEYAEAGGSVLGYGLAATTWSKKKVTYGKDGVPRYDVEELQRRARDVETLLQQWGGQQVDTMYGCSIEATMSATAGYSVPPICPKAPQTELDIVTQLPIMRPASLWPPQTSMWFRTSDGVLMPYQPMSKKQNAMISLITGGMGYGKSNCISEHIFYFANHPLARDMPYIRGIDFGSSSSGVIDMIRDSLPPDRKHEALFQEFTNDGSIVKNQFDTRLCLRGPLEDHKQHLLSFLSTICDELLEDAGIANVMNVLKTTIEEAYRSRDPNERQSSPTLFEPLSADPRVIKAIEKIELVVNSKTTYWSVVDALAHYGVQNKDESIIFAARVAQRHAVPQFGDLVLVVDRLADRFSEFKYKGQQLTSAIASCLSSANSLFPCLRGITNVDITESRVCVFDMTTVFGRGITTYNDWERTIYFSVAMRLLTEDLFVNLKYTGPEIKAKQKELGLSPLMVKYHLAYLESQDQVDKLFWADEVHRLGKVQGALTIIDSMGFEGRKYGVGILLGTQVPEHLPKELLKLASTIFVFGVSQDMETAMQVQTLLNLNDDERNAIYGITKPSATKGAMVFAQFKTTDGVQNLLLHFQMGGIKRWAYATEPDERALRGILYRDGKSASWARATLAKCVPDSESAIKAKMDSAAGKNLSRQEATEQIAVELLRQQ